MGWTVCVVTLAAYEGGMRTGPVTDLRQAGCSWPLRWSSPLIAPETTQGILVVIPPLADPVYGRYGVSRKRWWGRLGHAAEQDPGPAVQRIMLGCELRAHNCVEVDRDWDG